MTITPIATGKLESILSMVIAQSYLYFKNKSIFSLENRIRNMKKSVRKILH
jgi:hypothetical protein